MPDARLIAARCQEAVAAVLADPKKPRDECGVFGIYDHPEAARLTFFGLYALQHRGQESAGIVSSDGKKLHSHKEMGLVSQVFNEDNIRRLPGSAAIGHVRYSTTGSSTRQNAQPLVVESSRRGSLALAHNGNLVNAAGVRDQLEEEGAIFQTTTDTEVLAHLIARQRKRESLKDAVVAALGRARGGYALVILSENKLLAARDPHGIRPLSLARMGDSWVVASESCAFDTVGAEFVRDVLPGELVVIDEDGLHSHQALPAAAPRLCVFEYIYFARPDSNLQGLNVHAVRKELGRELAREAPADADLVIGVPDSSISAASGYAEESGLPYEVGLVKNRYIGRTFISPSQEMRASGVRLKLNPLKKVIKGKRVVLVDDSIVRGTTSRHLVTILREAGATEVHMRISSPPYKHGCHYGIDTSELKDLVATHRSVAEIREYIGCDSLRYLSLAGMLRAVGAGETFCTACFTADYPVPIPDGLGKHVLEEAART